MIDEPPIVSDNWRAIADAAGGKWEEDGKCYWRESMKFP